MNKRGRKPQREVGATAISDSLPAELQGELDDFAIDHTLAETQEWLRARGYHVSLRSLRALLADRRIAEQLRANAAAVETVLGQLGREDSALSPERLFEVGQCFFSAMALANQDGRLWQVTQELHLKRQRLLLEAEKYRESVAEKKAALERQINAAKTPAGISAETLAQIELELKLL